MTNRLSPASRRALALAGAAFVAGTTLFHFYLRGLEDQALGGRPVAVLVALRDVPAGGTLREEDLGIREIPEAYLDARRVRADAVNRIVGVPLATPIGAQESVMWSDLDAPTSRKRHLSALIAEGRRAITLSDDVELPHGLIRPGDRVDVLSTRRATANGMPSESTTTLLQNVLVLAVGGQVDDADDAVSSSGAVSLSVSLAEARLLAAAEHRSRLRLVLRHPGDIEVIESANDEPDGSAPRGAVAPLPAKAPANIERLR